MIEHDDRCTATVHARSTAHIIVRKQIVHIPIFVLSEHTKYIITYLFDVKNANTIKVNCKLVVYAIIYRINKAVPTG